MPSLLWIALVVVAIALLAPRIIRSRSHAPPDSDSQILAQLRKAGSDLAKPHHPEFFLYAPTEAGAQQVAGKLRADGFSTDVKHAATGTDWLCTARKELILTPDGLADLRRQFGALLASIGGHYDGWGTEVVK